MAENKVFLDRAQQLAHARDLLDGKENCSAATALLAIHTAIALNDALLLDLAGSRGRSYDHAKAALDTERVCRARKIDQRGLKHLRTLLSKKTAVSYGDAATSPELAAALAVASQRFQEWAYSILKSVRRNS